MRIEEALNLFGQKVGVLLELDVSGSCRLIFDNKIVVDIEAPAEILPKVFLSSSVGMVSRGDREPLYRFLLESSFFGRDTGETVIAIDKDLDEIVLFRQLNMERVDHVDFTAAIEDLVLRAQAWTEKLASFQSPLTLSDPGVANSSNDTILRA